MNEAGSASRRFGHLTVTAALGDITEQEVARLKLDSVAPPALDAFAGALRSVPEG